VIDVVMIDVWKGEEERGKPGKQGKSEGSKAKGWEREGSATAGESGGSYEDVLLLDLEAAPRRGLRRGSLGHSICRPCRHHGLGVCFVIGWIRSCCACVVLSAVVCLLCPVAVVNLLVVYKGMV